MGEIKTIAVIGAGDHGRGIAQAALRGGYRTILEDVSDMRLHRAATWIANGSSAEAAGRLVLAQTVEAAVRDADLIIETVADEVELKIEMFTIFDKFAKPGAIFASNSRLVPIAELAAVTFCPERCVGVRFISGAREIDTLELVRTAQSSDATMVICREVFGRMCKRITVVMESGVTESR